MKVDIIGIMEEIAKKKPAKIVICEGWDERCLRSTADILKNKLAQIVLLGNPKEIEEKAKEFGVDVSEAEVVDYKNSELKDELTEKLVEVRKHKGLTLDEAKKLIEDENYFGCMYAYCGHADAVAGSAIGSTAALMRPALQTLREKGKVVSEVSIMNDAKNDKVIFASDFSMNIDPDAEGLAQMTFNAVDCVKNFNIEPKVGLLSFSTKGSGGNSPALEVIREAVGIVKREMPDLIIDGELQVDAAMDSSAAKSKCPGSPLKGEANTLIFPNLMAANIFAHGLGQFSDMTFIFTVMKGMTKPVVILGRSMPLESVKNMIVSCAMQVNS